MIVVTMTMTIMDTVMTTGTVTITAMTTAQRVPVVVLLMDTSLKSLRKKNLPVVEGKSMSITNTRILMRKKKRAFRVVEMEKKNPVVAVLQSEPESSVS